MSDASMSNAAVHDLVQQLDDTALYNIVVHELPNKAAALEWISRWARCGHMSLYRCMISCSL